MFLLLAKEGSGRQRMLLKDFYQIKAEKWCLKDDKKLSKVLPVNAQMSFLAGNVNMISGLDTASQFLDSTF